MKKKLLSLILVTALIAALTVSVSAATSADVDMDAEGSISVTLETDDHVLVTDGTMTLYQVATLGWDDGNMTYTYTDAFANCGIELTDDYEDLAGQYIAWAEDNDVTGVDAAINSDGSVTFADLTLGLYLVSTDAVGYSVNPFLVSVPLDVEGVWVYNVDATPKTEVTVVPVTPPPDTTTPGDETPPDDTTTEEPTVPQTGQLNWPIPVLLVVGLAMFGVGWYVAFGKRKKVEA